MKGNLAACSSGLMASLRGRVGVGWRKEIASELMCSPAEIGFFEVVAESCLFDAAARREVQALTHRVPVIPHGIKLSLGSAEGIDSAHVDQIATLCKHLRAPCFSEHVSFVRAGGTEIGHLTPLPRTRQAVAVVARNVASARRRLPDIPLLLENVAQPFFWPDDEMTEAEFYQEIVHATGCDLLLDLSNLYANARNQGLEPNAVLQQFPVERVAMVHVAGGAAEHGFYLDTHAHAVSTPILELVSQVLGMNPSVPLLLERDANFDDFDITSEVGALARLCREGPADTNATSHTPVFAAGHAAPELDIASIERLGASQTEVANLLVSASSPGPTAAHSLGSRIGQEALARTRWILERKRVEAALGFLPRLTRMAKVQALAERIIRELPRLPSRTSARDAFAIVRAALEEPTLSAEAALELLLLRARVREGSWLARRGPFLGFLRRGDILHIVLKSFGDSPTLHVRSKIPHALLSTANHSSGPG